VSSINTNRSRNIPGQGSLSNSGDVLGNDVNDEHLGGKKTKKYRKYRKHRKQKGGYTYRDNKAGYIIEYKTKKNRNKTSSRKSTRSSRRTASKNSINY